MDPGVTSVDLSQNESAVGRDYARTRNVPDSDSKKTFTENASIDTKDVYVSEIETHEALSADWWDLKGTLKGLHSMNTLRVSMVKKGLLNTNKLNELQASKSNCLEGFKVLDVGCGGGILSEALAKSGAVVTGLDPSAGLVALAREHASSLEVPPPTYVCDTIQNHAEKFPEYYDAVVASEVIEHVPDKESFLTACVAALKPGGSLFLTTPNRTILSWIGVIIFAENIFHVLPVGFHSWSEFIHHNDLKQMIRQNGCEVKKVRGMFYNLIFNKWNWFFSRTFMYAIHSVKSAKHD